jgi:hypothetical protein
MSRLPFVHPVFGKDELDLLAPAPLLGFEDDGPAPGEENVSGAEASAGDLDRVVEVVRSFEMLLGALEGVSERLNTVRTYLAKDDCNVALGREYYQYWRAKHARILTMLRENRLHARRTLRRVEALAGRSGKARGPRIPS